MKLADVAKIVSGTLKGDGDVEITGVRDLGGAGEGDLSFVQSERHLEAASASRAAAFLVPEGLAVPGKPCVEVANPKFAFILVLSQVLPAPPRPDGIYEGAHVAEGVVYGDRVYVGPGAVVHVDAVLSDGVRIGSGANIGAGCRLGEDTEIHPNVTLYPGTELGNRCVIHAGSVLGADGFGYVQEGKRGQADGSEAIERYTQAEGPHVKVPQLGDVVVGDDVEIGAVVTIDRGTLGSTVVGRGTKIDNQVQIGHNARIGEDVIIVAEVGIGGSAVIGNHVTIGGNCGISEATEIGDFCIVGAHTLMYPGKKFSPRTVIFGNPAREAKKTREQMLALSGLPRLVKKVRRLEERIRALEGGARQGPKSKV
ncbi:MAG: UDP-3-O-(3-hydroxymyristoyl)glucosamine N-acyltransferase [Planctomycetota bacterium]|jgi:UDP-3-O-[3-hydroxymyristoyl] glucosamine N-acyltransferase